jgi:hypothetical protein
MFLRTVKAAGGKGVQHEYVRLVESYRDNGRNKQRVVCNLGRKDLLAAHLDSLIRLLEGQPRASALASSGDVRATGAWDWGPVLVARTLWRELGLETILDRLWRAKSTRRPRALGSGLGAGHESFVCSHERAWPGALVRDGLCV